jgi:hypothetical protein
MSPRCSLIWAIEIISCGVGGLFGVFNEIASLFGAVVVVTAGARFFSDLNADARRDGETAFVTFCHALADLAAVRGAAAKLSAGGVAGCAVGTGLAGRLAIVIPVGLPWIDSTRTPAANNTVAIGFCHDLPTTKSSMTRE